MSRSLLFGSADQGHQLWFYKISLFLIFIISLSNHLKFFVQFSFISFFSPQSCPVCAFFQSVLLFQKFCFHGAICLMGDIKFSFQLLLQVPPADAWFTSGCSSTCMQSLRVLVLLCWFHQEGPLDSGLAWAGGTVSLQPPSPCSSLPPFPFLLSAFHSGSAPFVMTGPTYGRGEHHYGVVQAS